MKDNPGNAVSSLLHAAVRKAKPIWGYLSVISCAGLCFLPKWLKVKLHTMGTIHGLAHVLVFMGLSMVLQRRSVRGRHPLYGMSLSGCLGIVIELAQSGLSGGRVEFNDILYDVCGAFMGSLIMATYRRRIAVDCACPANQQSKPRPVFRRVPSA